MHNGRTPIQGIFLDFFGTLAAGDREVVHEISEQVVADLGLETTVEHFAVAWGDVFFQKIGESSGPRFRSLYMCECESLIDAIRPWGRAIDPHPYVERLRRYWRCPPLHAEVAEVWRQLEVPICVVSNVDREDLRMALNTHDLEVADAISSEEARAYKPDGRVFELALTRTGWSRDRVIHVGDSLHSDVAGARACGLQTAWVQRPGRIHDIGNAEADYRFPDLRGLVKIITD
jgi:2-haloacid dehalogenase/putative hydrolase of the HAD superfamily